MNLKTKEVKPYPVNPEMLSPKIYTHKGEFSVMTIGIGCPDSIVGRSGPCTLVQYKGNYFVCDIGAGATKRMVEVGLDIGAMRNIFVTHMHLDHLDDYLKFMIESWTEGRRESNVVGVKGIKKLQGIFKDVFAEDIDYRVGKTGTSDGIYDKVHVTELEGKQTLEVDGVKITSAPTIHAVYNLAYRFDVDGKSIVVSGDTSYSESLIELAKDADVFVVDVGMVVNKGYIGPGVFNMPHFVKGEATRELPTPENYTAKEVIGKSHGTIEDIASMAKKANVKKVVFTHYPPFVIDIEALKNSLNAFVIAKLFLAENCWKFCHSN